MTSYPKSDKFLRILEKYGDALRHRALKNFFFLFNFNFFFFSSQKNSLFFFIIMVSVVLNTTPATNSGFKYGLEIKNTELKQPNSDEAVVAIQAAALNHR